MIGGALVRALLGRRATTRARIVLRGLPRVRWGTLRRTTPISETFGFDRGTPIDRYYVDRFFGAHADAITGDVLEIQLPGYTERFGCDVRTAHTLDIDASFSPTYRCDLARSEGVVPDARYDCFLLPNALPFMRDVRGCLRQARRIVRPGGWILASVPGFVPLTPDVPDYWRAAPDGWRLLAEEAWPGCAVEVTGHGNSLAAAAAIYGVAVEELTPAELDVVDPRFPVLVTIACRVAR